MKHSGTYRDDLRRAGHEAAAVRTRLGRTLGGPARFWSRAGERVFHYQLLRAQMIERAFLPDAKDGPCPEAIDESTRGPHDE